MWLSDPGCAEIVEAVWSNTHNYDPAVEVMRKIAKSGKELHKWNREHFGNVRKELEKKRVALKKAEEVAMRKGVNFKVRMLKQEITNLMVKENRMWLQRAKVLWASNGDKNSKFFHCHATQRKRKNSILKIRDTSSQWRTNPNEVNHCMVDYFQTLFTSTKNLNPHEVVNSINTIISEDMRS